MKLYELAFACRLYQSFTDFDESYQNLLRNTRCHIDLNDIQHRSELLKWLRKWGCRHLARNRDNYSSSKLQSWYTTCGQRLPREIDLREYEDSDLVDAVECYRTLNLYDMFKSTTASKILFALRPISLPPWDEKIRQHFNFDGSASSYKSYLEQVKREVESLRSDAERLCLDPDIIPKHVGRSGFSLVKLIDEYNWVTITKKCPPPTPEELRRWVSWL